MLLPDSTSTLIHLQNVLPYFPVLLEVYRGVHVVMFECKVEGEEEDVAQQHT